MNCKRCGLPLNEGDLFCRGCGLQVGETQVVEQPVEPVAQVTETIPEPTIVQPVMPEEPINNAPRRETLGIISMIFGIVALVFCWAAVISIPLGIAGLILGIINLKKQGRKKSGVILNSIALAVSIIFLGILILLSLDTSGEVAGKYDCKPYSIDYNTVSDNYSISLYLEKDGTFTYGPYGDLEDNHAKGTYEYTEDEDASSHDEHLRYYMIDFEADADDYLVDGIPSDHDFKSQMEFAVGKKDGKKYGLLMFVTNYQTFMCYEK